MATIASNTAIVGAACAYGGPWVCGVTAIAVVLSNFFLRFYSSSGPTSNSLVPADWKRDSLDFILETHAAHGVWTNFGNATLNGIHHDLHFRQSGEFKGLRAVQRSSPLNVKRDDEFDDGGITASYFWKRDHQQAWNDWDDSVTYDISQTLADYMKANNADIPCANLQDADGVVDVGVMTIETKDRKLGLTDSQYTGFLNECAGEN